MRPDHKCFCCLDFPTSEMAWRPEQNCLNSCNTTVTGVHNKIELVETMLGCASKILEELKESFPPVCCMAFFYMYLTSYMIVMLRSMSGQCLTCQWIASPRSMETPLIKSPRFTRIKAQEELSLDELSKLSEIMDWQSNEFLWLFTSLQEPSPESGLSRSCNAPL